MISSIRRAFFLAVGGVLLLSMPAMASTVTWESTDGKAVFNIQPTFIDITLTDKFASVDAIAKELDGITFTTANGSGSLSLSPTGVGDTAAGQYDCTSGSATCTLSSAGAGPWGWALGGTLNNFELLAGSGSLHPFAIVNSTVNGSLDGVSNDQHNPLLLGPVTFRLNLSAGGTAPDITGVKFYFGTQPAIETGSCTDTCGTITTFSGPGVSPVPEPASLLLIGSGLVIGARRVRRSWKRK